MNNTEPDEIQKAILEPIANELGIYGGEATYMARTLLKMFIDDDLLSSRRSAPTFYTNGKAGNHSTLSNILVYPNPATESIKIVSKINLSGDALIEIQDQYGRILKVSKLSKDEKEISIDIKDLTSSVYFVSLSDNNVSAKQKFIVTH